MDCIGTEEHMASWYDGPERVLYVVVGVVLLLTVMWVVDKLFCLGRTLAAAVRCMTNYDCCAGPP